MNEKRLISIILPVYNSEKTISDTIDSILNQTYAVFELIIINDGSTDKSDKIIKEKLSDSRIIYIKNDNHGVSYSRNYALKIAKGEYITFIDSDDLYNKKYLEKLYNSIKNNNTDWSICSYINFNKKEKEIKLNMNFCTEQKNELIEKLYPSLFNQLWNKIYKTSIIKNNKIFFDEEKSIAEDLLFNIEYTKYIKKIEYLDQCLYKYRISHNGLGLKFRKDSNDIKIYTIEMLEKLYIENEYDLEFIYKNYIIQYIAYIARIFDKRNNVSNIQRKKELLNLINSNNYKKNINKTLNSKKIRNKIIAIILLNKFIMPKKIIGHIANLYDMHQKEKIFEVLK